MKEVEDVEFEVIDLAYKRKRPVALLISPNPKGIHFEMRQVGKVSIWSMKNLIGVYDSKSPPGQIAADIRIFLEERKNGIEKYRQSFHQSEAGLCSSNENQYEPALSQQIR